MRLSRMLLIAGLASGLASAAGAAQPSALGVPAGPWIVQAGTPNTLARIGLTDAATAAGSPLTIEGYRSFNRDCSAGCIGLGREITFAGGQKIIMGTGMPPPPARSEPVEGLVFRVLGGDLPG